jgi:hypothetical protein
MITRRLVSPADANEEAAEPHYSDPGLEVTVYIEVAGFKFSG